MWSNLKALSCWCVVSLLFVASLSAADDVRLADAAKNGDKPAVLLLLKQKAPVNTAQADGATALMWAAHRDDAELVDLLIGAGADVNAANDYGVTALSVACTNGSAAIVEKLLAAGANPNAAQKTGETLLMTCAQTGNVAAMKSLLTHRADPNAKESRLGQTALMWAVEAKHPEVARTLVENGADIHARSNAGFTPLLFAARQGDLESARILLAAGARVNETSVENGSALVMASAGGREEFAKFLLENGADPNAADAWGLTSLHYTVQRGLSILEGVSFRQGGGVMADFFMRPNMPELVKALLAKGANPNARIIELPLLWPAHETSVVQLVGATPFLVAAADCDIAIMRLLLAGGADPELAMQDGTTPLMSAIGGLTGVRSRSGPEKKRSLEAVKFLLELGVNVNRMNDTHQTATHAAAYQGSAEIIQLLADKGAKIDVKDLAGQTPLSIAEGVIPATADQKTVLTHSGFRVNRPPDRRYGGAESSAPAPQNDPATLLRKLGSNTEMPAAAKIRGEAVNTRTEPDPINK